MSDERDDDDDTKSSKRSKKRFQERDDSDEGDHDRPRKKNQREDEDAEDDRPRSRRQADDADDEDDRPKKKRAYDEDEDDRPKKKRRVVDDGPRVKSNDNIPILMLLAFIGSAVGLLAVCAGCGWFSFDWLVGGGSGGGGWGGNEMEVTAASRSPGFRAFDAPNVSWTVKSLQNPSGGNGQYYVVMKCGNQTATEQIYPSGKGWTLTSGKGRNELKGANGPLDVWVEKRPNPVATGKVVSNVYKVP